MLPTRAVKRAAVGDAPTTAKSTFGLTPIQALLHLSTVQRQQANKRAEKLHALLQQLLSLCDVDVDVDVDADVDADADDNDSFEAVDRQPAVLRASNVEAAAVLLDEASVLLDSLCALFRRSGLFPRRHDLIDALELAAKRWSVETALELRGGFRWLHLCLQTAATTA
jgi:hypothetical protein